MKTAGIVACSDVQKEEWKSQNEELISYLKSLGKDVVVSPLIYEKTNKRAGTPKEKAQALMDMYTNPLVEEIYDISGGDLANEIIPYLDYDRIHNSKGVLFGYSDLTCVINAIYAKTGEINVLYQAKNLVYKDKEIQRHRFENRAELFSPEFSIVQGKGMEGIVVGGNLRCFLKLAGTEYFPDLTDKILLLESLGGDEARINTYLCQLEQLGAFKKIRGLLLGTFTEMQKKEGKEAVVKLVQRVAGHELPIAQTQEIGHGADSKAIIIGGKISV